MLYPPGFYFVKKPKRFVILSSDKSSERNLSSFFDIIKPWRIEHLQSEEPFSSDPYFSRHGIAVLSLGSKGHNGPSLEQFMDPRPLPQTNFHENLLITKQI